MLFQIIIAKLRKKKNPQKLALPKIRKQQKKKDTRKTYRKYKVTNFSKRLYKVYHHKHELCTFVYKLKKMLL